MSVNVAIKSPIKLTNHALEHILLLIQNNKHSGVIGIRVKIATKGCGGNTYNMEFCTEREDYDEIIEFDVNGCRVPIFIDKRSMLFLIGTEIDYVKEKLSAGFVFLNKKEKGRCGCGKSFYV